VGLQVSRGIYTEVPEEANLRGAAPASGGAIPRVGGAQGVEDCRRAHDGGPRSHVHQYSAEVCGGQCGRVHQRQERHSDCVSTVGLDEHVVRAYIRHQEEEDQRYEQLKLGM